MNSSGEEVIAALRMRPDVESAERAQGKANVVMMRFDRSCTSASDIVLELRRSGVAAVLVAVESHAVYRISP
jgi:hypothetical protein